MERKILHGPKARENKRANPQMSPDHQPDPPIQYNLIHPLTPTNPDTEYNPCHPELCKRIATGKDLITLPSLGLSRFTASKLTPLLYSAIPLPR